MSKLEGALTDFVLFDFYIDLTDPVKREIIINGGYTPAAMWVLRSSKGDRLPRGKMFNSYREESNDADPK